MNRFHYFRWMFASSYVASSQSQSEYVGASTKKFSKSVRIWLHSINREVLVKRCLATSQFLAKIIQATSTSKKLILGGLNSCLFPKEVCKVWTLATSYVVVSYLSSHESSHKPFELESSQSHIKFFLVESGTSHDLVESVSSHIKCQVTSSH